MRESPLWNNSKQVNNHQCLSYDICMCDDHMKEYALWSDSKRVDNSPFLSYYILMEIIIFHFQWNYCITWHFITIFLCVAAWKSLHCGAIQNAPISPFFVMCHFKGAHCTTTVRSECPSQLLAPKTEQCLIPSTAFNPSHRARTPAPSAHSSYTMSWTHWWLEWRSGFSARAGLRCWRGMEGQSTLSAPYKT